MTQDVILGVDIGTSSTKAVYATPEGRILRSAVREHAVQRPAPGLVEMDGALWWEEFRSLAAELAGEDARVIAVGVSGMGPCALLTDAAGIPLRPAILYGVDTRAGEQIARLEAELGAEEIRRRGGTALSSQAVGPKLEWVADHEPEVFARARRIFMPASWLAWNLTGEYLLDHHSASQCWPLYDIEERAWYAPWAERICPGIELPRLAWAGDRAGVIGAAAAALTGLPEGIPVALGTIDAWSEAASVGAVRPNDLMLMYGTTLFLVNTTAEVVRSESMWATAGSAPGTYSLAGGMATSGAITGWLRALTGGADYPQLLAEAEASGPGARGLLMLPYFAGERTPIQDPDARGVIAGLTLEHTRGDLYRAALEATAFGIRHNIEAMREAGARIERLVAVGGGAQGELWPSIVSSIIGMPQEIPTHTIGASLGAAFFAAGLVGEPRIERWNPVARVIEPDPALAERYDRLYASYRALYPATREIVHGLAAAAAPQNAG